VRDTGVNETDEAFKAAGIAAIADLFVQGF
jgi:hypothetical protein